MIAHQRAVPATDPVVHGDPQPHVSVSADECLALVAGHRDRTQVQPAHQLEHLLEEGALGAAVFDHDAVVAQLAGQPVRQGDPTLLGDPVYPLLDLDIHRRVVVDAEPVTVVAYPQLATKPQALDLLPVEAQLGTRYLIS